MFSELQHPRGSLAAWQRHLDGPMKAAVWVCLLSLIGHWGIIAAFILPRQGQLDFLRLHYTAHQGVDWIGPWYYIILFPTFATLTFVINAAAAAAFAPKNRILARVLLTATAFIEVLLAVGGFLIVLLNG